MSKQHICSDFGPGIGRTVASSCSRISYIFPVLELGARNVLYIEDKIYNYPVVGHEYWCYFKIALWHWQMSFRQKFFHIKILQNCNTFLLQEHLHAVPKVQTWWQQYGQQLNPPIGPFYLGLLLQSWTVEELLHIPTPFRIEEGLVEHQAGVMVLDSGIDAVMVPISSFLGDFLIWVLLLSMMSLPSPCRALLWVFNLAIGELYRRTNFMQVIE